MRKDKKWIRVLILLLGFILIAVSVFLVFTEIRDNQKMSYQEEQYRNLADHACIVVPPGLESAFPGYEETIGNTEAPDSVSVEEIADWDDGNRRLIDFELLCEENHNIIAWLYIPGTEVDYPILQHEDNSYYLTHNMDGSVGLPGCIYSETYNAMDFSDPFTVIYGHNMKNGTMFGNLKAFKDEDYFEEHKRLYLYLPDRTYTYEIIAASLYSDEHLLYDYMILDQESIYTEFKGNEAVELMEKIRDYEDDGALFRKNVGVSQEDTLLVLSTCDRKDTRRYLVIAKQIDENKVQIINK